MSAADLDDPTFLERFWSRVDKSGDCWEWTACLAGGGYGQIRYKNHCYYSHRVAFELANGPIPHGLLIDHKCWNRACVNPAHLQAVSRMANNQNRCGLGPTNSSGYRGVGRHKKTGQWRARVHVAGREVHLGLFDSAEEAGRVAADYRREHMGNSLMDKV